MVLKDTRTIKSPWNEQLVGSCSFSIPVAVPVLWIAPGGIILKSSLQIHNLTKGGHCTKKPCPDQNSKEKVITPIPSISCVRTLEGPGTGLSPRLSGLSVALWCQQNMSCKCWFLGSKHKKVNRLAACKVCLNDSCSVFLNFSKQRSLKCSGAKSVSFLIQRKFCGVGALTEVGVEAQWQNRNQK